MFDLRTAGHRAKIMAGMLEHVLGPVLSKGRRNRQQQDHHRRNRRSYPDIPLHSRSNY